MENQTITGFTLHTTYGGVDISFDFRPYLSSLYTSFISINPFHRLTLKEKKHLVSQLIEDLKSYDVKMTKTECVQGEYNFLIEWEDAQFIVTVFMEGRITIEPLKPLPKEVLDLIKREIFATAMDMPIG